jgi:hypothetical protein
LSILEDEGRAYQIWKEATEGMEPGDSVVIPELEYDVWDEDD